jgi:hypothetical protein
VLVVPLNSVQALCKAVLDGLPFPGSTKALKADRQTGPRGKPGQAGYKRLRWDVDVWLVMLTNPNNSMVDQQFPLLLDAVMAAFWSTEMPTWITDETTGLATQVLSIGEDYRMEYAPVHAPQTQRMLFYDAHLRLSIYEAVQA